MVEKLFKNKKLKKKPACLKVTNNKIVPKKTKTDCTKTSFVIIGKLNLLVVIKIELKTSWNIILKEKVTSAINNDAAEKYKNKKQLMKEKKKKKRI